MCVRNSVYVLVCFGASSLNGFVYLVVVLFGLVVK